MRNPFALLLATWLLSGAALPSASAAGCPTSVTFEPTGEATVDAGWTGIAHAVPIFGATLDLALTCLATDPPCGSCAITGLVASPARPERCRNDSSRTCTGATEVADCGAPFSCAIFLSPPQSVGIGGLPLCYTTELAGPVTGDVDVETGRFAPRVPIHTEIRWGVHGPLPGGGALQGCPRCLGDPISGDGVLGGTCDAGTRVGLPCDAQAVSSVSDFGPASFDCPSDTTIITEFSVGAIPASSEPQTITLGAGSPKCTGTGGPCFCGTCNDAAGEPCASDADCPPSGGNPGVCQGRRCLGGGNPGSPCTSASECPGGSCGRLGEPTKPHACVDDSAAPNGPADDCAADGHCVLGPIDTSCTNHPDRGCLVDADCDSVPGSCVATPRRCFTDDGVLGAGISVGGQSSPPVNGIAEPTDLGSLACVPPSPSALLNNVDGLPGLVRTHQPGRLVFGDGTTSVGICPATPASCRAPTTLRAALVALDDRSPDANDKLQFGWTHGAATTPADLGDPRAITPYALCLYDASGLRAALTVPAGGTCRGKPCWKGRGNGFVYRDGTGHASGVVGIDLFAGADGKAKVRVKAKGAALPLPSLPSLTAPLVVQLRNQASGVCFGATFDAPFDATTPQKLRDRGQ